MSWVTAVVTIITALLKPIVSHISAIYTGIYYERAKQAEKRLQSNRAGKKAAARIRAMSRASLVKWMRDNKLMRESSPRDDATK